MTVQEKTAKKIFVIGCGRWGTFIAGYLNDIGHEVSLYGRKGSASLHQLVQTRSNAYITLPETIQLTDDLLSIHNADVVIISIGCQHLQELADELHGIGLRGKTIVLCMKGIEISTGRRLTQIIRDTMTDDNRVAVWLGPGHVQEFCLGIPNCMVIDSDDETAKDELIQAFSSKLIRFYYGTDLIGNEIGAASKNVIGIAAGMLDGLNLATLKGALMSRGTREIGALIRAMGGRETSVYGLCHLGDYEATVFSQHSQNRAYGESFILGTPYEKLAEGYYTVKALRSLGRRHGVELPICEAVYQMLYCSADPESMLEMLFSRNLKNEF